MGTEWRAIPVSAPGLLWAKYAADIGEEHLREVFGDHWPPRDRRYGEEVWSFREAFGSPFDASERPAAWLSLTVDQFNPAIVHMSRGVWPKAHGRGLGRHMRGWAEERARQLGGYYLDIEVHRANAQHLQNVLKDPYWRLIAERFEPQALAFRHDL